MMIILLECTGAPNHSDVARKINKNTSRGWNPSLHGGKT